MLTGSLAPVIIPLYAVCHVVGEIGSFFSKDNIKSEIWFERTERRTYKAPSGHLIYADPTY
jgi:hypothetical protein